MNYSEMLFNRDERLIDRIKELEEENKRLKTCMQDTYDSANDICGELQSKINKAIRYIENDTFKCKNQFQQEEYDYSLLKILKGEENE